MCPVRDSVPYVTVKYLQSQKIIHRGEIDIILS